LYDGQYASNSENQNNIEVRIQDETPYIKAIGSFVGCETNLSNLSLDIYNEKNITSYTKVLGTSDLDLNYAASWDINFIKGEINNFYQFYTASNGQIVNIPKITTSVVFETDVIDNTYVPLPNNDNVQQNIFERIPLTPEDLELFESQPGRSSNTDTNIFSILDFKRSENNFNKFDLSAPFNDGTSILVEQKTILIDFSEKNTQLINDMFEIEVFKYDKNSNGEEILTKMFFKHNQPQVENNILLDETPIENIPLTKDFVEYYFNIFVDNEIDSQTICDFISPTQKTRNTMVSVVSCNDEQQTIKPNTLYNTNVTPSGETC